MRWWIWALFLAGCLRLVWPGDIPFVHDEAYLLDWALKGNAEGHWASHGLGGSRGIDYGPLPLWCYQIALSLTHQVIWIVWFKALLLTAATIGTLLGLARLFPAWPRWVFLIPMLSPYLWFYARDFWDNSLNVGFMGLLFLAYLHFLKDGRRIWLGATALLGACALNVHLMALPLVAAVGVHFLFWRREWASRHLVFLSMMAVVCVLMLLPYAQHLLSAHKPPAPLGFRLASVFFGLSGARLWTAWALEGVYGMFWFWSGPPSVLLAVAVALSAWPVIPSFVGMADVYRRLGSTPRDLQGHGDWICAIALPLHVVLVTANGLVSHPHYFNAIWIVFFWFFARGTQVLWNRRWARVETRLQVGVLALSLLWIVGKVHVEDGTRSFRYGTTLRNSLEIAAQWNCYPPTVPFLDNRAYSHMAALSALKGVTQCPSPVGAARELQLHYVEPESRRATVKLVPIN